MYLNPSDMVINEYRLELKLKVIKWKYFLSGQTKNVVASSVG